MSSLSKFKLHSMVVMLSLLLKDMYVLNSNNECNTQTSKQCLHERAALLRPLRGVHGVEGAEPVGRQPASPRPRPRPPGGVGLGPGRLGLRIAQYLVILNFPQHQVLPLVMSELMTFRRYCLQLKVLL